jgi:hypothetical protein
MTLQVTPAQAISNPKLLARGFRGDSWDRWKACLKAVFGEAMSPAERDLFHEVAEREPPTRPVREAWLIGRRSGKDSVASAVATTLALSDYREYLRPGEAATIV